MIISDTSNEEKSNEKSLNEEERGTEKLYPI